MARARLRTNLEGTVTQEACFLRAVGEVTAFSHCSERNRLHPEQPC